MNRAHAKSSTNVSDGTEPALFALLYVEGGKRGSPNLKRQFDGIDTYIRCAITLSRSCMCHGQQVTILTNEPEFLSARSKAFGFELSTQPFHAERPVPDWIPFAAAHKKLDVFSAFGSGDYGDLVLLLDLDCVALEPIRLNGASEDALFVYDLTQQELSASGFDVVKASYEVLGSPANQTVRWFGGEFLGGSPAAFKILAETVSDIWPDYINRLSRVHHHGDEMLFNAAVSRLNSGAQLRLIDQGIDSECVRGSTIRRWWSARTPFPQRPLHYKLPSVLHMPADKDFLAKIHNKQFSPRNFLSRYEAHISPRLLRRRILNKLLNWQRRESKSTPRIH